MAQERIKAWFVSCAVAIRLKCLLTVLFQLRVQAFILAEHGIHEICT